MIINKSYTVVPLLYMIQFKEVEMENIFNTVLSVGIGGIILYITNIRVKDRTHFISHNTKPFREHCTLDITAVGDNDLVRDRRTGKEIVYIV